MGIDVLLTSYKDDSDNFKQIIQNRDPKPRRMVTVCALNISLHRAIIHKHIIYAGIISDRSCCVCNNRMEKSVGRSEKTIIITGANSGIGLETAKKLCSLHHDVIISVRDDSKGEATIEEIRSLVPDAEVLYLTMDLTDPDSIREFVEKFKATGKSLNVLINNAGLARPMFDKERYSVTGESNKERTMTANCMGPFLLTKLLLDELKATGTAENPSRVVNVSSQVTKWQDKAGATPFYIDDLMLREEGNYKSGVQAYRNSKIAMNLWSNSLARQLKDEYVVVNTLCPGVIPSTSLNRTMKATWWYNWIVWMLHTYIGRWMFNIDDVGKGADRITHVALDEVTGNNSGLFYVNGQVQTECSEVQVDRNKEQIWGLCEQFSI